MESIGSRSMGCFPARFEEGEKPGASAGRNCPLPVLSASGNGGAPTVRGSVVVIFVAVIGGWLWNKQKM